MTGLPGRDFSTPDDPVLCHLCGNHTSLAMLAHHLETEHGLDPADLLDAEVVVED